MLGNILVTELTLKIRTSYLTVTKVSAINSVTFLLWRWPCSQMHVCGVIMLHAIFSTSQVHGVHRVHLCAGNRGDMTSPDKFFFAVLLHFHINTLLPATENGCIPKLRNWYICTAIDMACAGVIYFFYIILKKGFLSRTIRNWRLSMIQSAFLHINIYWIETKISRNMYKEPFFIFKPENNILDKNWWYRTFLYLRTSKCTEIW